MYNWGNPYPCLFNFFAAAIKKTLSAILAIVYQEKSCGPPSRCQEVRYVTLKSVIQAGLGEHDSRGLLSPRRAADTGQDETRAD